MIKEEKIKLSKRNLERILDWANILCKHEDYNWTRNDAELYFLIVQSIKKINKIYYNNNKLK